MSNIINHFIKRYTLQARYFLAVILITNICIFGTLNFWIGKEVFR